MIGTIISIMEGCNVAHDFYKRASGIFRGNQDKMTQYMEQMNNNIADMKFHFEQLSDTIRYAGDWQSIQDVTQPRQRVIDDLRDVRQSLEPVQQAIGENILSSAMIETPEKMQQAFGKSPWDVLIDIRPVNLAVQPHNPDMVPVIFTHGGIYYIGWQMRGMLEPSFDCHYDELWVPAVSKSPKFEKPILNKKPNPKPSRFEPPEIIVAKKGWFGLASRGDYETISDAIKAAKAGSRILVKPGTYKESLVIDKPLQIIGDGEVTDIVIKNRKSDCIQMKTDHALVRGLTLQCHTIFWKKYYAVDIPQGQLTLEDCDITSNSLACVAIHGKQTEGIIRHCKIHDSEQIGIFVYENGKGQITHCEIFGNALAGIEIEEGGDPIVEQCQIHDGKQNGIMVGKDGKGQITNCEIFGNALAGIEIKEGGNPTVEQCQIHDGKQNGIMVWKDGKGQITHCEIFGNALAGIEIKKGGDPSIAQCQIHNSKDGGGIYIHTNGKGQITNCEIFGNAFAGIEIKEGGDPTVEQCQIHDGKEGGIYVHDNGKGQITNCDIFGNALSGIEIREGGDPTVEQCKIHDNQGGFNIHTNGKGQITNSDIFGNAKAGITIKEGSNPNIEQCQIHDGKAGGIYVHTNGKVQITNCEIFRNAKAGISIREGSDPTVRQCTIKQNGYWAVWLYDKGTGTIEDCDLRGNEKGAWRIEEGCQVSRRGNKV